MLYHSCPALLILLLKVFEKSCTFMDNFNIPIPHLQEGQCVKAWRILYTAATSGLSEEQQRKLLPAAVDRNTADQAWAIKASERLTLKAALDELETRVDGKLTRLVATQRFFELRATTAVSVRNLSEFFFEVLEAGNTARVTYDLIALKFLQQVPGAAKLFSENETELEGNMTEEKVMALFDKVKERLQKKERMETKEKDEVFLSAVTEKVPWWAEELQEDIASLKALISKREQSAEQADSGRAGKKEVYYNSRPKQKRHTTKNCTARKGKGEPDGNR